jgi:hypothetical protein
VSASLGRWERKPSAARAAGETSGGQMADVVLIGIVVLILFAVGFTVGVLIVGLIGRWRNGRQRRDTTVSRDTDRN